VALRTDIIVLNDPARGIDVGAKTELYKHLRAFAEAGKSVVYLSSELEEFIGFATRVIVFRNGSPFDAFVGDKVEPKRILEAMFGQTDQKGLRSLETAVTAIDLNGRTMAPTVNDDTANDSIPPSETAVPSKRLDIKIVEFDAHKNKKRTVL
jgi:ribose transport system ATP-binding protein